MELSFKLDKNKLYFFKETNYLYTLDLEAFEIAFDELSRTSLVTSERSTDDHIIGTITTYEDYKTIMTTIPYDEGWQVYVDGKKVDIYSMYGDSFIAFDVADAGEHDIEFRYMPKIYVITGIISAISSAIFIALIVIDKKRKSTASIPYCDGDATTCDTQSAENTENTEGEN